MRLNIVIVIILIIILIMNIRLWNENLWYRIYMHQINKNIYDDKKVPFIKKGPLLTDDLKKQSKRLVSLCCNLKTSSLTKSYNAFDSDSRGGAIYWHELKKKYNDDETLQTCAFNVQEFAKQFAEEAVGEKLYPFENSMWNTFVLNYSGTDGSFAWHYDSENEEDYRVLFCIERTHSVGVVEYKDEKGEIRNIDIQAGQCYILRGSTTFHRVTNNQNKDDRRVMLGFHFSKTPKKTTKNLCYFSTLTNWSIGPSLEILFNQDKY